MIDFSKLVEAYADGHEIKTLSLDGKEVWIKDRTSPVTFYKIDSSQSGNVKVQLKSNGATQSNYHLEYECQSNPGWHDMPWNTDVTDPRAIRIRALSSNQAMAQGDGQYCYFSANDSECSVGLSGNMVSLLDKTEQLSVIDHPYSFNHTFYGQSKVTDISKLSCSAKIVETTSSGRVMMHLFRESTALSSTADLRGLSV